VITLVLGGARSGKSDVAERLAGLDRAVTYIATGVVTDPDMEIRIAAHRDRRPPTWATVEAGRDLPRALRAARGPVLVDSLGTWLAGFEDFAADAAADADAADADELVSALTDRADHTVVVSEEVGLGVHPSTEIGRRFRDALGLLNQRVAAVADDVVLVVAGRVLRLERAP